MTGKELRALRNSLGLTQQELADILKVTRVTVSNCERFNPSRELNLIIDRALSQGQLRVSESQIAPPTSKPKNKGKRK